MKNSLNKTGLSLSQAQSISNLCNQRCVEIDNIISQINNCSKTINVGGEVFKTQNGVEIPNNIVDLLKTKAKLHGCQAFLMENIKAKDNLLKYIKAEQCDTSVVERPKAPNYPYFEQIPQVDESYGWDQLTTSEYNEYLEADAFAAHIGQFIHKNKPLEKLRNELVTIPSIEWMNVEDGKKTPVKINVHHTREQLLKIHEDLASLHREYEQKVNYFKAKVKNAVTNQNALIAKQNADNQNRIDNENSVIALEYDTLTKNYINQITKLKNDFEINRQERIKEVVNLKITVDPRFQETIDLFLTKIEK